jgi:ribonuclease-3
MITTEEIKKNFKDVKLFEQALTHRSWINENPGKRQSNERLEFLGDAVLEFVVSANLYKKLPDKEEGFLTALRANIVNTTNLANLAKKLDLGKLIFLSKGERLGGGETNISLLADTVEAIIGAIYIDQGLKMAREFIEKNLLSDLSHKLKEPLKDAKSLLQETVQSKGYPAPKYKVVRQWGPDHDKKFEVEVSVNNDILARGIGKSKSQGEQEAAQAALVKVSSKE